MKCLSLLLLFISFNSLSSEECINQNLNLTPLDLNFTSKFLKPVTRLSCSLLGEVKTQDELEAKIDLLIEEEKNLILRKGVQDRHEAGRALRNCYAQSDSKGLIIMFEGTGSFDPHTFYIQNRLLHCLPPSFHEAKYYTIAKKRKAGSDYKWSGLENGPMQILSTNEKLNKIAKKMTIAHFPSEEVEALAGVYNPLKVAVSGISTPGINDAVKCVDTYLLDAKKKEIKNPKIIVLSHSSGGRSAVKFSEILNKKKIDIDLVFSIDPVKEAHLTVPDLISQESGNVARAIKRKFTDDVEKSYPLTVWGKTQKDTLYKTKNVGKWINLYQNTDEYGIGMTPNFRIQGSPVFGADKNIYLKEGLTSKAHGDIAYKGKTLSYFETYFLEIMK